jgi:hypothetical protein
MLKWQSGMSKQPEYIFFTDRNLGKQFPDALIKAGIKVEKHSDHFEDDAKDEIWLAEIGKRGWYAITHDRRIRYKPNEKNAVKKFQVGLFVLVGKLPFTKLSENFILTLPKIQKFIDKNSRPFIAKIYHSNKENKAGYVEMWESFH